MYLPLIRGRTERRKMGQKRWGLAHEFQVPGVNLNVTRLRLPHGRVNNRESMRLLRFYGRHFARIVSLLPQFISISIEQLPGC
jgi:hypothetical protein